MLDSWTPLRLRKAIGSPLALTTVVFLAMSSIPLRATDWYVDIQNCPGPGNGTAGNPFCKIQDGITAAMTGDTVWVLPGSYPENIDFRGKAISVKSTGGAAVTTIDGGGSGSVAVFRGGEGASSMLEGFTLSNGSGTISGSYRLGGGLFCDNLSSPTINDCVITGNTADAGGGFACDNSSSPSINRCTIGSNIALLSGGGVFCWTSASPTLSRCIISSNSVRAGGGGGIHCEHSSAVLLHCIVANNTASAEGGGVSCDGTTPAMIHCEITGNTASSGGGLFFDGTTPLIESCTISRNTATNTGGAIYCWPQSQSRISARGCILWGNPPNGIDLSGSSSMQIVYSDIQGGWLGTGNISANPLFVNPGNGDHRLQATSPCIDAGDPASAPTGLDLHGDPRFLDGDLDGVMRVDMGASEFDNAQLAITGNGTPGGRLTCNATGTAGLGIIRFFGMARGETLFQPFGGLYLDLLSPWTIHATGAVIPAFVQYPLPALPTPATLIVQDLGIDPASLAGNTSNPVEVVIQ